MLLIPLPPVTNCHTFPDPLPPLERDILYGRPHRNWQCSSDKLEYVKDIGG